MDRTHGKRNNARTQRLVTFLLFLGLPAWSQEGPSFFIETERVLAGARYQLVLRLPDMAAAETALPQLPLPSGLQLIAGPVVRAATWTTQNNRISSGLTAQWDLRAAAAGIWTIPAFEISNRGRGYPVGPVVLSVVDRSEASLKFPLELEWIVPDKAPVAGQSFTVALRVKNLELLPQPPELLLPVGAGNLVELLRGGGDVVEKRIGTAAALDVVWSKWLVTTQRAGRLTIPAFNISIARVVKRTPPLVIDILPLPPEAAATSAVGDFQYSAELQPLDSEGGLILVQELRGRGNFPVLRFLDPDLESFLLAGEEEIDETASSDSGYEGRRRRVFRLQLGENSNPEITLPGFSFWSPSMDRMVSVAPRVERVDRVLESSRSVAVYQNRLMDWDEVLSFRSQGLFFDPFQYLSLLPGILALLAGLFWPRTSGKSAVFLLLPGLLSFSLPGEPEPIRYQQARENYHAGRYAEAAQMTEEVMAEWPDLPLLRLSLALSYAQDSRPAEAIRELRRLSLEGIQHPWANALEADLELLEGLESQYKPLTLMPADNLFLVFALSANLGFLLLGIGLRRRLPWGLILSFFLLAGSVGTGVLGYNLHQARTELSGVVGPQPAALRKIPERDAESWSALSRGTTVQYLGKTDGFTRVVTGYGLEGWVMDSDLLPIYLSR